jgi:hypothetical protein
MAKISAYANSSVWKPLATNGTTSATPTTAASKKLAGAEGLR